MNVDGKPIDYGAIPEHMREGMRRYIEEKRPPGGFLTAVLANDLMRAVLTADDINRNRLREYSLWLYNYAPPSCYGSYEKVKAWLRGG